MKINVEIVSAFIDGESGGNPAGVVIDADKLNKEQKLSVAKAVGLSETAFVSTSEVATYKLEFFTPERQIAHCGHATIATFCRLSELGLVQNGRMSKETIDGVREIIVDGETTYMAQIAPKYTAVTDQAEVLNSLDISRDSVLQEALVVNTGNSFLLVQLADAAAVSAIKPNQAMVKQISEKYDLIGYYIFSTEAEVPNRHAGARMFAPRYGIEEESATGMAAGPLACFLHDKCGIGTPEISIEQGRLMQPSSPSVIKVELKLTNGKITSLMAGGRGKSTQVLRIEV